jgi:hypothetical protein
VQSRRRDATIRHGLRLGAAHKPDYDPNLANVKFLPRECLHHARCNLPEPGGGGAVGRGQREDALVLAHHLHPQPKAGRQDRGERMLHRSNPAHLHIYCYQVLQGI